MHAEDRRRALEAMGLGPLWVSRLQAEVVAPAATASPERDTTSDVAVPDDEAARRSCGICAVRTRAIAGDTATDPVFVVVGVTPSADGDDTGGTFDAEERRLCDAMLAAIGRARLDEASTQRLARREGRPAAEEIDRWRPSLLREVALLTPSTIVAMGPAASAALLGSGTILAALRGGEHALSVGDRTITVVVTHHPAHLLHEARDKSEAWADLCLARAAHARHAG